MTVVVKPLMRLAGPVVSFIAVGFCLQHAALAAWPCENTGRVQFFAFPAPVLTPGGHMASGAYLDDRSSRGSDVPPIPLPGAYQGYGTWVYLETNGAPGLQRGGASSLPTTPLTGANDAEDCHDTFPSPDELLVGVHALFPGE